MFNLVYGSRLCHNTNCDLQSFWWLGKFFHNLNHILKHKSFFREVFLFGSYIFYEMNSLFEAKIVIEMTIKLSYQIEVDIFGDKQILLFSASDMDMKTVFWYLIWHWCLYLLCQYVMCLFLIDRLKLGQSCAKFSI